ncbi:MAG: hypothetical protein Q7I98_07995 [Erysipelotrichaceae bacterium]|nr:hypothetical protein [Erysipelotrichaceae bacterium]
MEGDILSRMRLDISDFKTKLDQIDKGLQSTITKMQKFSALSSQSMLKGTTQVAAENKKIVDKLAEDHRKANDRTVRSHRDAADTVARTWWSRFGIVALGFTIAYRAMMAFEVGIKKVVSTIGEAIKESSSLAATQAKLAFWYQMHTKESLAYADVFEKAAVNVYALGEASVYSIATLDELTTGIDELAQSVGAVPANMIPAMASMVDCTVMVAQTTGSTIRQVRQEFQALMEGRIRTTDVMARSLIKTGIMSRDELQQMRDMQNQAEILNKVMNAVHERWTEARDIYREASIEAAKGFWEKALKMNIRLSVNLASELTNTGKVAGNLFAKVFVEHGKRAADSMKNFIDGIEKGSGDINKSIYNNVLMMIALRTVLDKALTAFEKVLSGISWFVAALYKMSDEVTLAVKALGGFFILGAITKLMHGLGAAAIWLAVGPLKVLQKAVMLVNASIIRVPLVLYASIIAIQAFFKTLGVSGEHLIDVFSAIPKALSGIFSTWMSELGKSFARIGDMIWEKIPKPIREVIEWIALSIQDSMIQIKAAIGTAADFYHPIVRDASIAVSMIGDDFKPLISTLAALGSSFGTSFGKNFEKTFLEHMKFLDDIIAPIIAKLSAQSGINFRSMLATAKKEGLKWLFKEGREETDREIKARMQKECQLLTFMSQINKDYLVGRLEQIEANAEDEYDIRLSKYKELTVDALAEARRGATFKEEGGFDEYIRQLEESLEVGIKLFKIYKEKMLIINGTMSEGFTRGIQNYVDNLRTSFEMGVFYATETARAMERTFSDLFFDVMTDEFKSWGDYLKSFFRSISRMLSELLSQMLMMKALSAVGISPLRMFAGAALSAGMGAVGSMAAPAPTAGFPGVNYFPLLQGGVPFHEGRIPMSVLPRFHDGLFPNEIPAIIRKDESVLTPKQMSSLLSDKRQNYNIFINAVDAASFQELTRRNPQAIIRPFVEALSNNDASLRGSLRTAMR